MDNTTKERFLEPSQVYRIWLLEVRSYLRYWAANFFAPVSEPIFYLVAFGFGFGKLVEMVQINGTDVPYGEFLAPGMVGVGVLFQAYLEGAYATYKRVFLDRNWNAFLTAPLTFADVFFGELLWAATRGWIAGMTTGVVAVFFGYASPLDVLWSAPVVFVGGLAFAGLGMASAALARQISQISIPMHLTIVPMFAFCGTYVPRELLPSGLREICDFLPLSSLVDLLRFQYLSSGQILVASTNLTLWCIVLITFSYNKLRKRLYQ